MVGEHGLHRKQSLHHYVANFRPNQLAVVPHLLQFLKDRCKRPLVASTHVYGGGIELEFGVGFVDGVVGEVHIQIAEILFIGRAVS